MVARPRITSAFVVIGTVLLASGASAFEPTGSPLGDHMLKMFEASGTKDLAYGSVSHTPGNVTFVGLTGKMVDQGDEFAMKIGNLKLEGGSLDAEEILSVDTLDLSGFSISSPKISFSADSLTTKGMKFAALATIKNRGAAYRSANVYESSVVTGFAVSTDDGLYLPVSELEVVNSNYLNNIPRQSRMSASNVELSTKNLPSGPFQQSLKDLGYDQIRFDITAESTWNDTTGVIDLPVFIISGSDLADLTVSFKLGGWTADLFSSLTNLDPSNDQQTQELLGKLQSTSINNLTIEVANKSVVDRVLDQQSKKAGVDRSDFVEQTITSLNVPLTFLQNPKFQQMISTQLKAFLSDPKSLQIQAAPANPIPVAQIVGMAMVSPQAIPDMLGVTIRALK